MSSTAASHIDLNVVGMDNICQVIREVVREELRHVLPTGDQPASLSIAEIVRDEAQRAFQPEALIDATAPDEPSLIYAAIVRWPPPAIGSP